jgi:hypothetical protein
MDWLLYTSNIVVGVIVWALTKFGIPFVDRKYHLDIPFDPATESELSKMVKQIWDKELLNHLNRHHSLATPPPPPPVTPTPPATVYTFKTVGDTAQGPAASTITDTGAPHA